ARGAGFRCVISNAVIDPDYIRKEAQQGRMSVRLMAIVAEGARSRIYLSPSGDHANVAASAKPEWKPDLKVTTPCHDVDRLPMYGMYTWGDAFTPRQLVALTTFSNLVSRVIGRAREDAVHAGMSTDEAGLDAGGSGAKAYSEAVGVYLAFAAN